MRLYPRNNDVYETPDASKRKKKKRTRLDESDHAGRETIVPIFMRGSNSNHAERLQCNGGRHPEQMGRKRACVALFPWRGGKRADKRRHMQTINALVNLLAARVANAAHKPGDADRSLGNTLKSRHTG